MKIRFISAGTLLVICVAAIYFVWRQYPKDSEVVAMSSTFTLTDEELRSLPKNALDGDCNAARRLGDFYFTQMANPSEAEKWYRIADPCFKDPRLKEFLIKSIILGEVTPSNSKDVIRLFREIERIDPERAERIRESTESYVGGRIMGEGE